MKHGFEGVNLAKIASQMTANLDLQETLTTIAQGLVDEFNASFARIWLLGPGDLCMECYKADFCANHEKCLHLKASAGKYINLSGEYRRVPLSESKLGRIATNGEPICTSDLLNDDRFPDKKWISENGFRSYGGYPLSLHEKLLGTIAMFSRHQITKPEFNHLCGFASQASIAIKCAQFFAEVEKLKNQLQAENIYLREEIKLEHNFDEIIGQSAALRYVLFKVEQIAATDTTVLILGETGTGKELIARAIHSRSARKDRPLVKVSCASLPANLIESELFGHERGAFTSAQTRQIGRFELADGATIFLDEIGELPLELQSRLLRVLQDGEFERLGNSHTIKADTRIIAATNRDLEEEVHRGNFRKDLWYRLDVFPITLPPLRERTDDIPLLVNFMIQKFTRKLGRQIQAIPSNVMKTLQTYGWPGNVRELENVIERAVINTRGSTLQLAEKLATSQVEELAKNQWVGLEQIERDYIFRVLEETRWKIEGRDGASRILDLNPSTLRGRMRKLGIQRP